MKGCKERQRRQEKVCCFLLRAKEKSNPHGGLIYVGQCVGVILWFVHERINRHEGNSYMRLFQRSDKAKSIILRWFGLCRSNNKVFPCSLWWWWWWWTRRALREAKATLLFLCSCEVTKRIVIPRCVRSWMYAEEFWHSAGFWSVRMFVVVLVPIDTMLGVIYIFCKWSQIFVAVIDFDFFFQQLI